MKITAFILLVGCLQVSAKGYTQKVTLSYKNASLETIFNALEKQTNYVFFLEFGVLQRAKKVSIEVKDIPFTDALSELLRDQELTYSLVKNTVIIEPAKKAVLINNEMPASKLIEVKGRVVNEKGEPIEGVTVAIKGSKTTVTTNSNGEFSLNSVDNKATLIFSHVAMEPFELNVDGKAELVVKLKSKIIELSGVDIIVSTGYQDLPKERSTGSFVKIDNELFNRKVGNTVLDRLDDVTPGLFKSPSTPSNPLDRYTIRGISTINASKRPLLVVDNFIYEEDPNLLNPNDVESISILKDAAAASIWGVRSGNGVIVVKTKRGKYDQKSTVSFNSNITIGEKPDLSYIPSIPSEDIINLEMLRFNNGYYDPLLTSSFKTVVSPIVEILAAKRDGRISAADADDKIANLKDHDVRSDINKYLLQKSIIQQYSIAFSGGGNSYSYYASIGFDKTQPNDINKYSVRKSLNLNSSWKPFKRLEISSLFNYIQNSNISYNNGSYSSNLISPYYRLADNFGSPLAIPFNYRKYYTDTLSYPGLLDWQYRPLDEARNGNIKSLINSFRLATNLVYTIIPELKAEIGFQFEKLLSENRNIRSQETYFTRDLINKYVTQNSSTGALVYPIPLGGVFSQSNGSQNAWNLRGQVSYNKNWGRHDVSVITGIENRQAEVETVTMATQYGFNPNTNSFGVVQYGAWPTRPRGRNTTISPSVGSISGTINRFGSYYANGSYTFNKKYTVSSSGRIDQSNFFGVDANDRKVPLWSVGGMWNISKEPFFNVRWFDILKLRATYGYNGNTNPGTTPLPLAQYVNPDDPLYTPYATLISPPNPHLQWEKVRNINLGVDFAMKGSRINGVIEVYKKVGIDLISQISVAPSSGFVSYTGNNASIVGKGIDFNINGVILNKAFKWLTSFYFNYNTEKVFKYNAPPPTTGVEYLSSVPVIVGKPLNYLYSFQWAGLDSIGNSRLLINKKVVGSADARTALPEDMVYGGRTVPPISGAFRNDFNWKNITVSINIIYRVGYFFRRSSFSGFLDNTDTWNHRDYLSAWKKPGDELTTNVPAYMDSYPDDRYFVYSNSNILIEKGDHVRLQDVKIQYDIFKTAKRKNPFSSLSVYSYLNNVCILWRANNKGIDPDAYQFGATPNPKTISIGVKVNF